MIKKMMVCGLCGALCALLCASSSFAQEPADESAQTVDSAAPNESAQAQQPATPPQGEPAPVPTEAAPAQGTEPSTLQPGRVTVNFKGADIKTVLSYISEVGGVDIVPAPDVEGPVDLKLTNKHWKTALEIILRNYGYAYEQDGDIIRVLTIDRLKQEELATQTFGLNYADSEDVVSAVKDMLSERGKVVYDERTNMVLVTDVPTNNYKIGEVIAKLDRSTPQVLIEALIIETVLSNDEKLGIDWSTKIAVTGARRPTTLPFESFKTPFESRDDDGNTMSEYFPQVLTDSPVTTTVGVGGVTSSTEAADFPGVATGVIGFPYAQTDDFAYGTLDFSQFSAVLEMLRQRADTEVISNPRITTLDNKEAKIQVGQTIGLPKYERNSSTGKMEIIGYESKELGINLTVIPHINDNGEIVVELTPQILDLLRYDVLNAATGVMAPVYASRQANTQVMVRDGNTIFIGGLIRESERNYKKKLPLFGDVLGDVPIVGLLFSKKEVTKEKVELIFFITVHLISKEKEVATSPRISNVQIPEFELYKQPKSTKKDLQ